MSTPQTDTSTQWQKQIFAATLFVVDLAASRAFYSTAFDLDPVFEDDNSAVFAFAGTLVNLLSTDAAPELVDPAPMAPPHAGVRAVFTIHVADVDARAAELQSKGVTLLNGPMDRPWGPRTASFSDPDGYVWEIAT